MASTSVTIFLIGKHSSENEGKDTYGRDINAFIKRELQATLYDGKGFRRSGLLGIVLPEMEKAIYGGKNYCDKCGRNHIIIRINDDTVIREFSANYYLRSHTDGCGNYYNEEDCFCVIARYSEFMNDPDRYIDQAYDKLNQEINDYVHWRNLR